MSSKEAWNEFHREANRDCTPTQPLCWWCGADCSGDTIESVAIEGQTVEAPVCDPTPAGSADSCIWAVRFTLTDRED